MYVFLVIYVFGMQYGEHITTMEQTVFEMSPRVFAAKAITMMSISR